MHKHYYREAQTNVNVMLTFYSYRSVVQWLAIFFHIPDQLKTEFFFADQLSKKNTTVKQ